jgi:nucleotide-binding universal stress UspA family protein
MSDKRPILLATDGSPSARAAEETALELAQRLDAELLVYPSTIPSTRPVATTATASRTL